MLGAALDYCREGWSVIPVEPKGKVPLVPWRDFQQKRATEAQIRKWWAKHPDANIGVITGEISGIVAVDVDTDRGGRAKPIAKEAPTKLVSRTGGGGYHLIYQYPGSGRVQNKVTAAGIDVRGDGGYIVVPPSIHSSGRAYRWKRRGQPGGVLPAVVRKDSNNERPPSDHVAKDLWLVNYLRGIDDGHRDDGGAKLAGYLAGKHVPPDVAEEVLALWNIRNDPPLPRSDIRKITRSVYETTARRQGGRDVHEMLPGGEFPVERLRDWMLKYDKPTEWDIEGWLPSASITGVVAPPGSFKTWLLIDLAVSVATGTPFMGQFKTNGSGPVIFVQQEDPIPLLQERIGLIMQQKLDQGGPTNGGDWYEFPIADDPEIYVHTLTEGPSMRPDIEEVRDAFCDLIRKVRPRLVIMDPLYSIIGGGDDFWANAVHDLQFMKTIRTETDTGFLWAHHTSKGQVDTNREAGWGSQFLNAFIETGWQIRKTENDNSVIIHRHFKTARGYTDRRFVFNISTDPRNLVYEVHAIEDREEPMTEMDIYGGSSGVDQHPLF